MPFDSTPAPATHMVIGTERNGRRVYYTGCAGEHMTSDDPRKAFVGWYESGAVLLAERLNLMTPLHGILFEAAPAPAVLRGL